VIVAAFLLGLYLFAGDIALYYQRQKAIAALRLDKAHDPATRTEVNRIISDFVARRRQGP
jgi:hypothetical protein